MFKNVFRLFSLAAVLVCGLGVISCGVSTGEVVDAGSGVMNDSCNDFICVEEGSDLDMGIPVVVANNIPIIEICPPPFEAHVPGEAVPEKVPGKPGESYDNLLPPVDESDCDTGVVFVFTDIPGVEVSFNNRIVGVSDIGVVGITPRIYILGLSKEGYKEENLWISVGEKKKQCFFVKMEPLEN